MSMRERKRNVKIRQSWQSNNSHWNVAIISLPSLMVVRLSQVIDIDLLPNIEITAEQVSFEWSHHSWFLFNDSIDREQNSTLHGSVISIFSSLFDCKLSEFDTNCKILFTLGFQLLGKKWLFWIDCTLWGQYKWWWSLSLDGNVVFFFCLTRQITVMIKVVYLQIIFNSATTHWFQKEKFAARWK